MSEEKECQEKVKGKGGVREDTLAEQCGSWNQRCSCSSITARPMATP